MALDMTVVAPGLTGAGSKATDTGFVAGVSEPEREGWLVHNGSVSFLSPGVRELVPTSVTEAGVAVGRVGNDSGARAFLFDGTLTDLQPILGTSAGEARDIAAARVVVGARQRAGEPRRAFRLDLASGAVTAIPFAPGLSADYVTSIAVAVTADGNLAVGLAAKAFGAEPRGFIHDHAAQTTTDLGPDFLPRAINNRGVMAGMQRSTDSFGTVEIATGTFRARGEGLVEAMNDDGDLVGSMRASGPLGAAFLSRPGQPPVDLNTLVAPGLTLRMTSASDITNGARIVGTAIVIDPATGLSVPDPVSGTPQVRPFSVVAN